MSEGRVHALVVDDEPAARAALRLLLDADPEVVVQGECADGRSALAAIRAHAPDVLFLDIQMPGVDGFALLRELPADTLPVVVFVTAHDRFALQAFEARALDYLLKPFDDARFGVALARAKEHVRQRKVGELSAQLVAALEGVGARGTPAAAATPHLTRLAVKEDGRVAVVAVADVDYFAADGDYVTIHAGRRRHELRETMKRLEEELDPAQFVRIHRSTIVNVGRIRELQPWFRGEFVVLLQDGTRLKLSRGSKPRLEAALGRPF